MSVVRRLLRWVRALTTGRDNQTPDLIRIGGILLGAQYLVLTGWSVLALKNAFDALSYGSGAAALLAAIGGALRMKASTEPYPGE
jgi:hypothetical protein